MEPSRLFRRRLAVTMILTTLPLAIHGRQADAGPCTPNFKIIDPNYQICAGGTTNDTLTYPASNVPPYPGGNYHLNLDTHVVHGTTDGIVFEGVTGGDGDVILFDSQVTGNDGHGIVALANGSNTELGVSITYFGATGTVTGSKGGIFATSSGAGGDITVNTSIGTEIKGNSGNGIFAEAQAVGNVVVDVDGKVTGTGNIAAGIFARTAGGTVQVTTGDEAITGGNNGIEAHSTGGAVTVITGAGVVTGNSHFGIFAASVSGLVRVTAGGDVKGMGDGIVALTSFANISVETAASTMVEGSGGDGIQAKARGQGNVEVKANSAVTGSRNGIYANAKLGTVKVITGTANVTGSAGIDAEASGDVTVETQGVVTGTGGNGIHATSTAGGNVLVETQTTQPSQGILGANGAGIDASATDAGTITIRNDAFTRGSFAGIKASSEGGAILITNDEQILNQSLDAAGLAIQTSGGATTIDNHDRIIGRVKTGDAVDKLNNNNVWITDGESDFGGGSDEVTSEFLFIGGPGNSMGVLNAATFTRLETLNNNYAISLADQLIGDGSSISDRLETDGNYAATGVAYLQVDAFLGGAGSVSDVFSIGGDASGRTRILVNDTGAGAYNPTGIQVVHVEGSSDASTFTLAGPIDKGLFTYELLFDAPNGDYLLVSLPGNEAFETLAAVAGAQEIWRETADAWSTRQEDLRDVIAGSQRVTAVADPVIEASAAPTGRFWASALGSWTERDDDASFSFSGGNLAFDTSYKQSIHGFVGGADFRADLGGDGSLLFGAMGGYVDSTLDFDESSTRITTRGTTLGVYASLLSGGFFATVLGQADLLELDYSTPSPAEDDSDSVDVTSIGLRGDFGYRFIAGNLFVEPMISIDAISTEIDEFSIGGSSVDAGTNESYRAGAGLRAGFDGEAVRLSATARLWDVFATDNGADILSDGPALGLSDNDLEGVYGDVSGRVDINVTSDASFYLKGGILFSDDVTKPSASAGVAVFW